MIKSLLIVLMMGSNYVFASDIVVNCRVGTHPLESAEDAQFTLTCKNYEDGCHVDFIKVKVDHGHKIGIIGDQNYITAGLLWPTDQDMSINNSSSLYSYKGATILEKMRDQSLILSISGDRFLSCK